MPEKSLNYFTIIGSHVIFIYVKLTWISSFFSGRRVSENLMYVAAIQVTTISFGFLSLKQQQPSVCKKAVTYCPPLYCWRRREGKRVAVYLLAASGGWEIPGHASFAR